MRQQAKLLRVLETGEMERVGSSKTRHVNVRILSATNADIRAEVEAQRFRADLLFRLNTVEIHLPPLRERREDIPPLAAHFLSRYAQRYRKQVQGIDPAALQLMLHYAWPGNVRELDHTIERAVLMSREDIIEVSDLGLSPARVSTQALEEMSSRVRGEYSHPQSPLALQRQRESGGRSPRTQPRGPLPADGKIWHLARPLTLIPEQQTQHPHSPGQVHPTARPLTLTLTPNDKPSTPPPSQPGSPHSKKPRPLAPASQRLNGSSQHFGTVARAILENHSQDPQPPTPFASHTQPRISVPVALHAPLAVH